LGVGGGVVGIEFANNFDPHPAATLTRRVDPPLKGEGKELRLRLEIPDSRCAASGMTLRVT